MGPCATIANISYSIFRNIKFDGQILLGQGKITNPSHLVLVQFGHS